MDKYDWLVSATQSILKHYSCPDSCNAKCCKYSEISINKEEYKEILKVIDKESAELINSNTVNVYRTEFCKMFPSSGACVLLVESKCRIYNNRPEACRKFPFFIVSVNRSYFLGLQLCPLSINIIRDYALWYQSIDTNEACMLMKFYEQYRDLDCIIHDDYVEVNEKNLNSFISFLEELHRI
jgi:Fe-S-cluster containining protein